MSLIHLPYASKPSVGSLIDPSHLLSKGCVGCWLMNEGAGNILQDISGNRNNGTLVNGALWSGGRKGSALKFDGTNDYVVVPYNISLYQTTMTVSFWAKSNITNYTTNGYAVSIYDFAATKRMWGIRVNEATDKWNVITSTNGSATTTHEDTTKSVTTSWAHLVFATPDAGDTWYPYYNGIPLTTLAVPAGYSNKSSALQIGGLIGVNAFDGLLDDVRIYNRVLSLQEIKQLYSDPFCNILQSRVWVSGGIPPTAASPALWMGVCM